MKEKKKKFRWLKILGITVLVIILILAIVVVAGYFYLRSRFGGAPDVNLTSDGGAIVSVAGGQISGGTDDGIYTFLGVPYAEAKESFKAAEAVTPWEGVRECVEYGTISPQTSFFGGNDSQDNNCQN